MSPEVAALVRSALEDAAPAYPLRVLYVEDSPISREVVKTILTREGHTVACAEDGEKGVRVLSTSAEVLDVVIVDHEMPGINGIGVVRYLRQIAFRGGVVIHSAALDEKLVAEYGGLGVRHFLPKPTNASELIATVNSACAAA